MNMNKFAVFTLILITLALAACSDENSAKAHPTIVTTQAQPTPVEAKQETKIDLKKFEDVYAERSRKNLPMTVGMLKSSILTSYKNRYGFFPCVDPRVARVSPGMAQDLLGNLQSKYNRGASAEGRSAMMEIERLRALIRIQPDEYAPLLVKGSELASDNGVSLQKPMDDLLYIPFAPNANELLREQADFHVSEDSGPLSALSGFGAGLFLPSSEKSEPGLPKGTKVICVWFEGRRSTEDYCCSCSMRTALEEDCSQFVTSCEPVAKCCGGKNAFWELPIDSCSSEPNPIVDPRVWLDTAEITKIGVE